MFSKKQYLLLFILSLIITIITSYKLIYYFKDISKSKEIIQSIERVSQDIDSNKELDVFVNPPVDETDSYYNYVNEPFLQVNFDDLIKQNEDTVAWINVLGTKIDYPVVQTQDNDFYLDHSFNKTQNIAGWVFGDFRNNFQSLNKNTIIYAHKMTNQSMFGSLPLLLDDDWFLDKEHHLIKTSTMKENMIWQIFSVYVIPKESYYITTHFKNDDDYKAFLETIKNRSIKDFGTSLDISDKILTLSTCKDYQGNRIAVHAKLIKKETR